MRQYAAYAKLITSTNRRRSNGTLLGLHGVSGRRSGSSWRCITKCDTLSWFDQPDFYQILHYCQGKQGGISDVWELF